MKINIFLLLLFSVIFANGQTNGYKFKRNITGINSVWHSMKLPDQMYKNANAGFDDLRIFGINAKDTIEVPYLLKQRADQIISKEVDFKPVNESANANGYYFTFELNNVTTINQINLAFKEANFNWLVTLEGSNSNTEWFRILKDYRILSIKNNDTDYQFTKLSFPDSKYLYYRLMIRSAEKPGLLEALINKTDTIKGTYQNVKYKTFRLNNDAVNKETVIDVTLENPVPLSYLSLNAQSDFDFYRSIKIEYATDSFKTDKGMQYNYASLYQGTLSSLEKTEYNFENTIASRLKITIQNNDNKPLRLGKLELKGNIYEIIARFDNPKLTYAIFYGNDKIQAPSYEIEKFENKIPENLTSLTIGEEQKNPTYTTKIEKPLFENKVWLWALMAVIIALLGWFSFKMLKN
ncbi:hypothetical protein [Pedobacter aquatilis]|uniref:hypothetical protein n=1 Tax=Pedobacter aquatilis TaxID=351343 RepID=UPI0029305881|nr:hypothetical protein [Pedobacter aquatilis]